MAIAALLAFVAGVGGLQWQAVLPSPLAIAASASIAIVAAAGSLKLAPSMRSSPSVRVLLLVCCAVIGFGWAAARAHWRIADQLAFEDEGRDVQVIGTIASLPLRIERGVRFEFEVEKTQPAVAIPPRILLGWYAPGAEVRPGERWQLTVRLRRPHGVLNPGGFDLEAWLLERNLRATGYVRSEPTALRLARGSWRPSMLIERARWQVRDRLEPLLADQRYGGVLMALILGDQRAIASADWSLFSRTGISHLVSISGLHITMIAGLFAWGVAVIWRRVPALLTRAAAQTAAVMGGLLAALAYAMLAGWGVPAQRTVLMLAVVAVAWLASGRVPLGTALAVAAAVVCVFDPWAVLAPGFWLSFGAVAAIAWTVSGRVPREGQKWRGGLLTAARVQMAVTLALAPALIVLFHQLPLVSPLANAVAIPVVSWIVTPLALIGGALALLPSPLDWLAAPLLAIAHSVFAVLALLLQWIASPVWSTMPIATPPTAVLLLAAAGVAWLLAPPGWPLRAAGLIALLPIFVWPAARPGPGELWITAIDVGQGSAVLLETRTSRWLYDAGPRHASHDAGERIVLPYLRHRGIDRLDGLIVSHLDSDHSGGAASILRAMPVAQLISSITVGHLVLDHRNDARRCEAGMRLGTSVDELRLEVLHPTAADYAKRRSTNAMSCVVRVDLGPVSALLTGDIPAADEASLVAQSASLAADWLMVPHHGSRSSSSAALLSAVAPRWALVQAGYRNRYGHPDPAVLARLQNQSIAIGRTDWHGALQWRFGANGWVALRAWREDGARYWHNRPSSGRVSTPEAEEASDDDVDEFPLPAIAG